MSTNQYLTDAATRHAVFLNRYAGGQSKEAQKALSRIRRDINARLSQEPTQFQAQRLNDVLKDINELYATGFKSLSAGVKGGTIDLAESEAAFSTKLFNKGTSANFALPSTDALIAAVSIAPMAAPAGMAGITIDAALAQYGTKKAAQISQIIADGVVLGDTTPVISRKVGRIINTLQRRQLDTLVRTITNHTSSVARMATYERNSEIIEGYQFIATLDNRTTMICASNDGKVFQVGMGPVPPLHWGACVENTLITTRRGKIPIQDVMVGDYALTHTGRWKRVNAVMAKPEKHKVVTLVDDLGSSVSLTVDHPVLTINGYKSVGDIHLGDKCFNHSNKFINPKNWRSGPPVEQAVLINAHNMKTDVVERLVAYSVTSLTAGVSASIKLDGYITNNKISDIVTNGYLRLKCYVVRFKEVIKKLLVKCKVIAESISQ